MSASHCLSLTLELPRAVQVLQGELAVWVKNPMGDELPGVWGKVVRTARALQPMLKHAVRVLPAPKDLASLTSTTLKQLEKKLNETSTALASLLKHGNEQSLTDLSDASSKASMSSIGAHCSVLLGELQINVDKVKSHHMVMSTEMVLTKCGDPDTVADTEKMVFEMKLLTTQLWETKAAVQQMFKNAVSGGAQTGDADVDNKPEMQRTLSGKLIEEPEEEKAPKQSALLRTKSMMRRAVLKAGEEPPPERGRLLGRMTAGEGFSYAAAAETVNASGRSLWSASCFVGNDEEGGLSESTTLMVISKKNYVAACLEEPIRLIQAMQRGGHFPYMVPKKQTEMALHFTKKTYKFNDLIRRAGTSADEVNEPLSRVN